MKLNQHLKDWHPFLRINHQGQFLERSQSQECAREQWMSLAIVVPTTGTSWSGKIRCFS
jgi:hypothetical protein